MDLCDKNPLSGFEMFDVLLHPYMVEGGSQFPWTPFLRALIPFTRVQTPSPDALLSEIFPLGLAF